MKPLANLSACTPGIEVTASGSEAQMRIETEKMYTSEQDAPPATDLVRGGVLFLVGHILFIGLGMLAYFAS